MKEKEQERLISYSVLIMIGINLVAQTIKLIKKLLCFNNVWLMDKQSLSI